MIPLVDLKAQYRSIKAEVDAAVHKVLEDSAFVLGPAVAEFEKAFADYCGVRHCVALNSGTSALHLALLAAGIAPGDEVITVSYTFVATVAAVEYAGARPVLVDIEPRTFCMDPARVEAAITPRTKAILPVHLYGHPADMDPILEIARRHGLKVIEDAAQAHGAEYKGRRVGGLGELAAFSFYPGKNLGAYGEGGAVTTNNDAYAEHIRLMRDWGMKQRYYHAVKAFNYRMEGLQGAILGVKLRHLERWTELRRSHAAHYATLFAGSTITAPSSQDWARHVYCVYAIRAPRRDQVHRALAAQGIQTGIHYPVGIHEQEAYQNLGYRRGDFTCSEEVAREELSLPVYPELTPDQVACVARAVIESAAHS